MVLLLLWIGDTKNINSALEVPRKRPVTDRNARIGLSGVLGVEVHQWYLGRAGASSTQHLVLQLVSVETAGPDFIKPTARPASFYPPSPARQVFVVPGKGIQSQDTPRLGFTWPARINIVLGESRFSRSRFCDDVSFRSWAEFKPCKRSYSTSRLFSRNYFVWGGRLSPGHAAWRHISLSRFLPVLSFLHKASFLCWQIEVEDYSDSWKAL